MPLVADPDIELKGCGGGGGGGVCFTLGRSFLLINFSTTKRGRGGGGVLLAPLAFPSLENLSPKIRGKEGRG